MPIHEEVLAAAQGLAAARKDWSFALQEVVSALPALNQSSVRTHVVSRCCVNAPKNHLHKWDYFCRIGRGRYRIEAKYRRSSARSSMATATAKARPSAAGVTLRRSLHAVIHKDEGAYVVECLELPVVTQGSSLDEAVDNLREALALHLEGEDLAALGLSAHPDVQISYEMTAA